nr:hypothetical protein [Tanacetum cinerariifolium]
MVDRWLCVMAPANSMAPQLYHAMRMLLDLSLLSCWRSAASGPVCVSRTPLGMRIVTTVHLPFFPPFDEGLDTCLDLNVCRFFLRGSSSVFSSDRALSVTDQHCATFGIPAVLRPELPDQNAIIKDSPKGKIGICLLLVRRINGWLSFSKRGGADDLCCYSKKFDSLKNSNNSFFWIDASVCLLSTPWFNGTSVVKDPLPVKVGERTLVDNEVPLNTETEDRVISPSAQTISFVDHIIQDELNYDGKSPSALRRLSRQNEQADTGFGFAAHATEVVTSSSVTPTPERVLEDASHDNVRTRPPSGRFVILSFGSTNTNIPASPQVVPPVTSTPTGLSAPVAESVGDDRRSFGSRPEAGAFSATPSQGSSADDFYESQTIDSASALNVYVPNWNVTNNAQIDNPSICQNLLDHVTPPGYWVTLHNQHDVAFLDAVNINSAQHVCMISELCLRYEHEIMTRENFEKKFTNSAAIVREMDAEIADLKAWLEKFEAEAAKVIELRKRVFDLKATVAIKVSELANFHKENVGLVARFFALELERDGLKNQVMGEGKMREEFVLQQDATERRFAEHAAELDTRIADVRCDMENDLYPHMLTAIVGRRWVVGHSFRLAVYKCARSVECCSALGKVILMAINKGIPQGLEAGIVHGKAGRSLAQVEAYDPEVERKYVVAFFEFEGSAKRRGLCLPFSSASGGTSGPAPSYDSSMGITDYQVSTLVLAGDGGSTNQPTVTQPHDDLFYTFVLDKHGDV